VEISTPQHIYLKELDTKFRAYVGGLGAGKTFVGCLDLLIFATKHKGFKQGYFGPTYASIRDIFYPTIEEAAELMGLWVDIKVSDKEVFIYKGRELLGSVICRSMDRPNSIIGFKICRGIVDEIDTMPLIKAQGAWNKIIARLREKVPGVINGLGVTCTPEGYLFVYDKFKKKPTKSYSMVQASTHENSEFLPDDYIDSLLETYPEQLVKAYVNGEFVNLTSGSVYGSFDRRANHKHWDDNGTTLHMGNDFNVQNTSASIGQMDNGVLRIFKEYTGVYDSPALVQLLERDFPGRKIMSYPDASGKNRHTANASTSDHAIINKVATLRVSGSNPAVKDRYMSVNKAFEDSNVSVDTNKCPGLTDALEQQIFDKNGIPEKETGLDHILDSLGYQVYWHFKIVKPSFRIGQTVA